MDRPTIRTMMVCNVTLSKLLMLSLDGVEAAKDSENSHDSGAEDMEYPAKPRTRADQIAQLYRAFIDFCIQLPTYGA